MEKGQAPHTLKYLLPHINIYVKFYYEHIYRYLDYLRFTYVHFNNYNHRLIFNSYPIIRTLTHKYIRTSLFIHTLLISTNYLHLLWMFTGTFSLFRGGNEVEAVALLQVVTGSIAELSERKIR